MLTANKSKAFKKLDPDTAPFGDYVFGELVEIPFDDESVRQARVELLMPYDD